MVHPLSITLQSLKAACTYKPVPSVRFLTTVSTVKTVEERPAQSRKVRLQTARPFPFKTSRTAEKTTDGEHTASIFKVEGLKWGRMFLRHVGNNVPAYTMS